MIKCLVVPIKVTLVVHVVDVFLVLFGFLLGVVKYRHFCFLIISFTIRIHFVHLVLVNS